MKNKGFQFLGQMLCRPRSVGSVWPSSGAVAERMSRQIPPDAKLVVEIGPGTGAITERIIANHPRTAFVLVEVNATFISVLHDRFGTAPNVRIVHGSAERLHEILAELKLGQPHAIVCTLPFASLPTEEAERILAVCAQELAPEGYFIAIQYTKLRRALFAAHFGEGAWQLEIRNLPPTYVLALQTKRS